MLNVEPQQRKHMSCTSQPSFERQHAYLALLHCTQQLNHARLLLLLLLCLLLHLICPEPSFLLLSMQILINLKADTLQVCERQQQMALACFPVAYTSRQPAVSATNRYPSVEMSLA